MDKKEFLQEFIDFLKGVEEIEFCHESNDPESDRLRSVEAAAD